MTNSDKNSKEQSNPEAQAAERVRVLVGEWREGQGDIILETRNLGPCIGIAIYEPEVKEGIWRIYQICKIRMVSFIVLRIT